MFRETLSASLATMLLALPAPAQDAAKGEKIFKKCAACHAVGEDAKNRVGPVLTGVVGRVAGTYDGYKYGASMTAAGAAGLIWDEQTTFDYLADPKAFLRAYLNDTKAKAKMTFRLKTESDRQDVIAYLASFSSAMEGAQSQTLAEAPLETSATALCVRNLSQHEHLFAVETTDETRRTAMLAPGEVLCTQGDAGTTGKASVFEKADELEGCTRLTPVGATEGLLKYVDFDRCFWSSNS